MSRGEKFCTWARSRMEFNKPLFWFFSVVGGLMALGAIVGIMFVFGLFITAIMYPDMNVATGVLTCNDDNDYTCSDFDCRNSTCISSRCNIENNSGECIFYGFLGTVFILVAVLVIGIAILGCSKLLRCIGKLPNGQTQAALDYNVDEIDI